MKKFYPKSRFAKTACILFFMVICFAVNSCKKNSNTASQEVGNNAPLISNAVIKAWFTNNPAGAYFTPDWTKARQTTIGGVPVVTVPILSITNVGLNNNSAKTQGVGTSSSVTKLTGFNPNHPPALYFF
ncbi:hypothetical protein [uncultured Mucilaginibacter sp.]|uniref:hypothetical protein n=1 Tax=uncultured Mucilaginibacter sp. TaxID=797541 RepID=UPI0025E4020E|nr:hypothetical protein [uncultured Mucilaginibacter sp.]